MSQVIAASTRCVSAFTILLLLSPVLACGGGSDGPGAGADGSTGVGGDGGTVGGTDGAAGTQADAAGLPVGCQWRPHSLGAVDLTSNIGIAVSPTGETAVVTTREVNGVRDLIVAQVSAAGAFDNQAYGFTLEDSIAQDTLDAAYDADGTLHIAFANNNANSTLVGSVYYTTGPGDQVGIDNGGLLRITTNPRLILANGQVQMVYRQTKATLLSPETVRRAIGSGKNFQFDEILSTGNLEFFPGSLGYDVDQVGHGHVVALDPAFGDPNRLLYAEQTASGWTATEEILQGENGMAQTSLSSDDPSQVHIASFDEANLFEVTGHAGAWSVTRTGKQALFGDDVVHVLRALQVDKQGKTHLTWVDSDGGVQYEEIVGGAVSARAEVVPPSDLLDPAQLTLVVVAGQPYLAYLASNPAQTERDLFLARCEEP